MDQNSKEGPKFKNESLSKKHPFAWVIPHMGPRGKFYLGRSFFTPLDFAEFSKLNFTASTRHTRKPKTSFKS